MAERVERMWCEQCGDFRRCTASGPNHVLHLLVVVSLTITANLIQSPLFILPGALAFFWVIAWVVNSFTSEWRCGECGARVKRKNPPKAAKPPKPPKQLKQSIAYKAGAALRGSSKGKYVSQRIPPRPSAYLEEDRAAWDAKYGKR